MAQNTYQVVLSADGKHQVIVTTDNQGETKPALAWAKATYDSIIATYGTDADRDDESEEEAPECKVHHLPMVRVQGRKGVFWSCHQKNEDGSWCSYKPSQP